MLMTLSSRGLNDFDNFHLGSFCAVLDSFAALSGRGRSFHSLAIRNLMELIAWIVFGFFYIGPYVVVFVACCAAFFLLAKIAYRVGKGLGRATLAVIAVGFGWLSYEYMWSASATFKASCTSGTGIKVIRTVKADSYALMYTPNASAGLMNISDATFEQAILNVATKKVKFVELQDSLDPDFGYGLPASLAKFRSSSSGVGYYKVFVAPRGAVQCRWVMPVDLNLPDDLKWEAESSYRVYLSYGLDYKLNERLTVADPGKECIAVDYVLSPTSTYSVQPLIGQKIGKNLLKHEIRVVDTKSKSMLIGHAVAYEHTTDNVYTSVAFWLGNGTRHPRCPLNLLEGHPVHEILHI